MLVNYNDRNAKYKISNADQKLLDNYSLVQEGQTTINSQTYFKNKKFENPYLKTYLTDPNDDKGTFKEYTNNYAQLPSIFQGKNAFIVDDDAKNILSLFKKERGDENFSVSKFIDNNQIKNKNLSGYLTTNPKAENLVVGYQDYLKETNNIGKAYDSATFKAKAFNAAANMALNVGAMVAITAAITLISKAWDKVNVTVTEQKAKVDGFTQSIASLQTEYQSLAAKDADALTGAEQERLKYLKERIPLEKSLLEIETKKLHQNVVGTGITDYFDKDSLKAKRMFVGSDYVIDTYKKLTLLTDYNTAKRSAESQQSMYEDSVKNGAPEDENYSPFAYEKEVEAYTKLQNYYDDLMIKKADYQKNQELAEDAIRSSSLTGSDLKEAQEEAAYWYAASKEVEADINELTEKMSLPQAYLKELDDGLKNISLDELKKNFDNSELELLYSGKIEFDQDATMEELRKLIDRAAKAAEEIPVALNLVEKQTEVEASVAKVSTEKGLIERAVSEQEVNGYVSAETYQELITYSQNYTDCLEEQNGAYVLNKDLALKLADANANLTATTVRLRKEQAEARYIQLIGQLKDYSDSQQDLIAENLAEQNSLRETIHTYQLLEKQLQATTLKYEEWNEKKSAPGTGENYYTSIDMMNTLSAGIENKRVNNDGFEHAASTLIPESVLSNATTKEEQLRDINRYKQDVLSNYFIQDEAGGFSQEGIDHFIRNSEGMLRKTEAGGYELGQDVTIEKLTEKLNLTKDAVFAVLGEMKEYDWGDGLNLSQLFEMEEDPTDALFDHYDTLHDKVEALKQQKEQLERNPGKLLTEDFDTYHQLINDLADAEEGLDQLNHTAADSVVNWASNQEEIKKTTEELDGLKEKEEEQGNLSEKEQRKKKKLNKKLEASKKEAPSQLEFSMAMESSDLSSTDEIDARIQETKDKLSELEELGVKQNADAINASQEELNKLEALKKLAAEEGYTLDLTTLEENITDALTQIQTFNSTPLSVTTQGLDQSNFALSALESNIAALSGNKKLTLTINSMISTSNPSVDGDGDPGTKTSGAKGKSKAFGTNSLPISASTLTGELGPELVVRGNQWFTVGDQGAEFVNLKQGDIVFNHQQTKDLLKKGKVPSRGHMKGSFEEARKQIPQKAMASGNTTETFDWMEPLFERMKKRISELGDALRDMLTLKGIKDTVKKTFQEISQSIVTITNAKGHYQAKADAVGLPADYVNKVQNGVLHVEDIADEGLQDKISEYEKWYNKLQDCNDELKELKEQQKEIAAESLSSIQSYYERRMDYNASKKNIYESKLEVKEANGEPGSGNDYKKLIARTRKEKDYLEKQRSELSRELNRMVKTGYIKKYSEEWYDWKSAIDDCTVSIENSKVSLSEYYQSLKNLPLEAAELKLKKIDTKEELLDEKYENASFKGKVALLNQKNKNANDKVTVNAKAKNTAETTFKADSKTVTSAINKASLSKKNKNSLLTYVKSKQAIPLKALAQYEKTNPDLYEKAVAYNASLEAKETSVHNYNLSKEEEKRNKQENQVQKYEEAAEFYDSRDAVFSARKGVRDAQLEKLRTTGKADAMKNSDIYRAERSLIAASMAENEDTLTNKKAARNRINLTSLKQQEKDGLISANDYKRLKAQAYQLEEEILQLETDQSQLKQESDAVAVRRFTDQRAAYTSESDAILDRISLAETEGRYASQGDYERLIDLSIFEQTNLTQENDLLKKQQAQYSKGSDLYQQLQEQMDGNNAAILEAKKNQAEYNRTLAGLPLEKLEDELALREQVSDTYRAKVSLHEAQGRDLTTTEVSRQITNNNAEMENQRGIYATQLAQAEKERSKGNSKAAKELQAQAQATIATIYELAAANEELNDSYLDIRINALQKEMEALQKVNDISDRRIALEKAQYELERAKTQRTKRVFNGSEFVYTADREAIRDAEANLKEQQEAGKIKDIEDAIDALEDQKENYNLYDENANTLDQAQVIADTNQAADEIAKTARKEVSTDNPPGLIPIDQTKIISPIGPLTPVNNPIIEQLKQQPPIYQTNAATLLSTITTMSQENAYHVDIKEITLNNVQQPNDLARAIIEKLPGLMTQELHKR